jgi:glucose dehydrogenase
MNPVSKKLMAMFVVMSAATCMYSCGSVNKDLEEDGKDNVAMGAKQQREEHIEVKDAEAQSREKFRKETLSKVKANEEQLAELREKMNMASGTPSDKLEKQWNVMAEKNTALKEKLQSYNEASDTSWTIFSNTINADLREIDQSLNNFQVTK